MYEPSNGWICDVTTFSVPITKRTHYCQLGGIKGSESLPHFGFLYLDSPVFIPSLGFFRTFSVADGSFVLPRADNKRGGTPAMIAIAAPHQGPHRDQYTEPNSAAAEVHTRGKTHRLKACSMHLDANLLRNSIDTPLFAERDTRAYNGNTFYATAAQRQETRSRRSLNRRLSFYPSSAVLQQSVLLPVSIPRRGSSETATLSRARAESTFHRPTRGV